MRVGVPKETNQNENRVALVPPAMGKLKKLGLEVVVEKQAGLASGFTDKEYEEKGARLADKVWDAGIIAAVNLPPFESLQEDTTLICMAEPLQNPEKWEKLAGKNITCFSLELIPRISRAQAMDVLSSQANIGGYKAVLLAAARLPKLFPLMMTAAGTASPAKVFVLGAGVAGLQAIATALESFKLKYGDYPWLGEDTESPSEVGNAEELFNVLTGRWMMYSEDPNEDGSIDSVEVGLPPSGRSATPFLPTTSMTVDDDTDPSRFLDPWGNPYRYYYVEEGQPSNKDDWNNPGYILLSAGPDGRHEAVQGSDLDLSTGNIPSNADDYYLQGADDNADNIVHGFEF